jgi:predicted MFS family arabinose efflux permease
MAINMINPMIKTLIGSHFPQEERSKVLGWSAAGTSIAYLVFSPLVSFIAGFARWRMTFLVVMLPLSLLALATTFIGIPQATSDQISENTHGFFAGFRSIFSNKSAIFCLLGTMLTWASFTGTLTYGISFFRERFSVTVGWASLLLSAMALSKTVGHLLIGSLVTRAGRKSAVVASVISTALFTAFYLMSKNLWLSIVLVCISCVLAGFMHSSVDSLNLEQVPEFHGSMMSLGSAASTIGSVIGSGLGGLILIFYGYSGVGAILGLLGLVSGIVYQIFALDPSANNVS